MKKLFFFTLIFGIGIPVWSDNFVQSDSDQAIRLVSEKYEKEYRKRLEGTGVNPSYMAHNHGECNWTVKVGTHQPTTWSVMDSFDVDICHKTVEYIDWRVRR